MVRQLAIGGIEKRGNAMNGHEDLTRSFKEKSTSDRSFGWLFGTFFVLVGLWPLLRAGAVRGWALVVGSGFLLVAQLRPTLLSKANSLWMKLSVLVSRIMNPMVIGVLFFVVVAPVGLLRRLFGKDVLRLRRHGGPSYWILRDPPGPESHTMTNQF